ncbi:MAG: hypothetical protein DYH13_10720 [Alphaproteobacteria bacterium PRO2]|nr:hypothetical protein [Alphaproteobacteria bacterium PRO2]
MFVEKGKIIDPFANAENANPLVNALKIDQRLTSQKISKIEEERRAYDKAMGLSGLAFTFNGGIAAIPYKLDAKARLYIGKKVECLVDHDSNGHGIVVSIHPVPDQP